MVKELPHTIYSTDYKALTRAQVFCTADDQMSINLFVFGGGEKEDGEPAFDQSSGGTDELERLGSRILTYAQTIQMVNEQEALMPGAKSLSSLVVPGDWSTHHPRPSQLFERESLLNYFKRYVHCNTTLFHLFLVTRLFIFIQKNTYYNFGCALKIVVPRVISLRPTQDDSCVSGSSSNLFLARKALQWSSRTPVTMIEMTHIGSILPLPTRCHNKL